jgi:CNT family concentrative nucleoside transporter
MSKFKNLFLTLLCVSFAHLGFAQEGLKYRWDFSSIEDTSGVSLLPIDSSDYFTIEEDGTFIYELKAKDLLAEGKWIQSNETIAFTYTLPADTVRYYLIKELNDSLLTINEGEVNYKFSRQLQQKESAVFVSPDYDFTSSSISFTSLARGILGISFLVFLGFLLSSKRKKINWPLVVKGLIIQIIFALAILKVSFVRLIFDWLSEKFVTLLGFTREGAEFLFGGLISDTESFGYIFAFQVLPTVIFFSALTSLMFYYGILQKIVFAFAWIMKRTMKLSGAESLAAAGNVFLGQTESPLLVKPYIKKMTMSELLCLMSGGMATIAGGVLAAYIGFLGGVEEAQQIFFAKHLLAASVMSAPAAVVAAKLLLPETEKVNEDMSIQQSKIGTNALEAISNGTTDGLRLAVNVGAMLLVFLAFIAFANSLFAFIGDPHQLVINGNVWIDYKGFNDWIAEFSNGRYTEFSLQFILGYSLAPITWLMGVDIRDMVLVGQLLGEKTILNEFVAYISLGDMKQASAFASPKSIIIATYILCGFSNFASIGIQIGGIGSLAPSRKGDLSKLGFKALIGGTLASLFTAVIVGMLI